MSDNEPRGDLNESKPETHVNKRRKAVGHHDPGDFDDENQLFIPDGWKIDLSKCAAFTAWRIANGACIEWLDQQMNNPRRLRRGHVKQATIEALIDVYGDIFGTAKTDPDYGYNDNITPYV